MRMTINKWGNSLATRIPKAIVDSVSLHLDQEIDIKVVNGKIIITPVREQKEYKLGDLLNQCKSGTKDLGKEDREWLDGSPAGGEVW